jgi:hypothetical protein
MIASINVAAIADAYMTPQYFWPYGMALLAMVVFAFLGLKSGQPLLWAFGGVTGGLSLATIASGLANAIAIPYVRRGSGALPAGGRERTSFLGPRRDMRCKTIQRKDSR